MARRTKLENMASHLNEHYRIAFPKAFKEKFDVEITTGFNLFAGALVSTRIDGQDFTPEQITFLSIFESGYLACMNEVHD